MAEQHSMLGASTAHRWLNCTPSVFLEKQEGLDECSVFAEEGTAAHTLAEIKLAYAFNKINHSEYELSMKRFHEEHGKYYNKLFEDHVDDYVDYVVDLAKELDAEALFEVRVDFSNIVPDGFGTADTVLINREKRVGHIIDLKFGQGVPVTSKANPQLRLYGIGTLNMFSEIDTIFMTIYQPRLDNVDTDSMSKTDLIAWGNDYVKPRAEKASKGEGILTASEDTCRWCKLRGKCKVRADMQLTVAKQEFAIEDVRANMVQALGPEQISNILDIAPMFIAWFNDVKAYALSQLAQGVKIPGHKVVEGRSNRIITDTSKVKEILLGVGLTEDDIMKPQEMQGLTNLEKLVGKKLFESLCKDYLIKPVGKLTLATEDDRRPAVNSLEIAKSDFTLINDDNQ